MKTIDLKDWERTAIERGATQLRRVIEIPEWADFDPEKDADDLPMVPVKATGCLSEIPCPFGSPGDTLDLGGVRVVVKAVRVERVQDALNGTAPACMTTAYREAQAMRERIDADHGAGTWEANPWQWVCDFKRTDE